MSIYTGVIFKNQAFNGGDDGDARDGDVRLNAPCGTLSLSRARPGLQIQELREKYRAPSILLVYGLSAIANRLMLQRALWHSCL